MSESFLNKVIIKDTRKERNGWKLQVIASPLISEDTFRLFPENTIKLKSISDVSQISGLKGIAPTIVNSEQFIDGQQFITLVSASEETGYGIYEMTFPSNALQLELNPAFAYVRQDGTPLKYQTDINWRVIPN
ncbi:WxL domain-containing protein [Robertmurraya kyonggiensis]|uniref:WxL domain-containing protein n=1 Tax=Robertmurraya kyonggiensis TaxID=1037680 RepID=UPI00130E21A7